MTDKITNEIMNNDEEHIDYANVDPTTLDLNEIATDPDKLADFMESYKDLKDAVDLKDYTYLPALAASFQKAVNSKKEIVDEIKKIEDFYIFQILLSQFIDDAVAPDVYTSEILTVTSPNPKYNEKLQEFQEKFNLDLLALDILPELVKYGSYCLKPEVASDKGIVDLCDVVNSEYIIPVTKHGEIEGYIYQDLTSSSQDLKVAPVSEFVNFSMAGEKLRIETSNEYQAYSQETSTKSQKLPTYLRIGKSMFYAMRTKIKELQLLEALVPASKLAKLSNGSIVGVRVPASYGINQAIKFSKKVENSINKQVGINPHTDKMTIENMMNTSGRIKTVPIFGDKGMLDKLDYKSDEPDDLLSSVTDLRQVICTIAGVPYELIFGGEDSKGAILKRHSRYIKKLRSIQSAIARGVVDLLMVHFGNLGEAFEDVTRSDINVALSQKLVEIENLDQLEFVDGSIAMIKSVIEFTNEIANEDESTIAEYVDTKELANWVGGQLKLIGLNIIDQKKLDKDLGIETEDPDEEDKAMEVLETEKTSKTQSVDT